MCPTVINWPKFSEIVFEAALTGLISAAVILITYWLGKRQEDIKWNKENERRDKENKKQALKEFHNKQIDILKQLIDFRGLLASRVGYDYLHHGSVFLDGNEKHRILTTATFAMGLFVTEDDYEVSNALKRLIDLTSWDLRVPDTEEKTLELVELRKSTIEEISQVFVDKFIKLEKILS
jgi:hypothetical protein